MLFLMTGPQRQGQSPVPLCCQQAHILGFVLCNLLTCGASGQMTHIKRPVSKNTSLQMGHQKKPHSLTWRALRIYTILKGFGSVCGCGCVCVCDRFVVLSSKCGFCNINSTVGLKTVINNKAVSRQHSRMGVDYELCHWCADEFWAWMFLCSAWSKAGHIDRQYCFNMFAQKRAAESELQTPGVKVTIRRVSVHTCMKCISSVHHTEILSPTRGVCA